MKDPLFFPTPQDLRAWFLKNASSENELWVGYYHKKSGIPSITWSESVDEALCFGWIDGIRYNVGENSYKIRFTPRSPKSHWSAVNLKKMEELINSGKMTSVGMEVFEKRDKERQKLASYEQQVVKFSKQYLVGFKANKSAWTYFRKLAPSYKKASIHWVMSAKREETRQNRLKIFINSCAEQRKIPMLRRKGE